MANSPKILIVDDEEMVCNALTLLLKSEGHHVISADSAEAAMEILAARTQMVALLITDLRLPGMDGVQLIGAAREMHPQLPIIALTAHALDTDLARIRASGVDDVLTKPLHKAALLERIARHAPCPPGPDPAP